jgi:hypothetical protein
MAEILSQFFGDASCNGGGRDSSGLRAPDHAIDSPAGRQTELGDLGAFSRAGVTRNDQYLVIPDRLNDVFFPGSYGELIIADKFGPIRFSQGFFLD